VIELTFPHSAGQQSDHWIVSSDRHTTQISDASDNLNRQHFSKGIVSKLFARIIRQTIFNRSGGENF
jgi:hypothetical protein